MKIAQFDPNYHRKLGDTTLSQGGGVPVDTGNSGSTGGGTTLVFSVTDGVTTVDPTTELTFVDATLTDLGGGNAEIVFVGGGAPSGSASGDLGGSYPGPTVVGIQGTPVDALPAIATEYLNGTGHFSTPAGAGGSVTTPTIIQRSRGVNSPFTLGAAPTVGHRLVLGMLTLGGSTTAISSANTTWTQVGTDQVQNTNHTSIWVGVCAASPGATITVTHTGTSVALVLEVADALTPTTGTTIVAKVNAATYTNPTGPINVTAGHFLAFIAITDASNPGVAAMLSCPFTGYNDAPQYSGFAIGYAPSGDVLGIGLGTSGSSCVSYLVEIT